MRRILAAAVALALVLAGCAQRADGTQKYEATFLTLFDTVTTVVGYAESEEAFGADVAVFHDELQRYHRLYDIYNDYEGVVNLKTVNDRAGQGAIAVEAPILALLQFAKEAYTLSDGAVNVAMGSVLQLWHAAREEGIENPETAKIPDRAALEAAAQHMDIANLVIDQAAETVELKDPAMRLDVGAVGKGFAVEQVCRAMEARGVTNMLLSVGGNVRAIGSKQGLTPWVVGIEDPAQPDGDYLKKIYTQDCSVVTSGSYQRYYTVEGKIYHHIIDPKTRMPADYVAGVTIVCPDAGLADALSTALFNMPQADGQALLARVGGAQAIWVLQDGTQVMTEGLAKLVKP